MLTNTLLLYMTQEALTKARRRLKGEKDDAAEPHHKAATAAPIWQDNRRQPEKRIANWRH